jgi:superfamily I DNA/RNA helicase/RecB family exonuclease
MVFEPDIGRERVLSHSAGPLLVTGPAGTGKTAVLRERFARLIEGGADPERVALVVWSRRTRRETHRWMLERLQTSLPVLRVMTVHALAYHVLGRRYEHLGYERLPDVLTAARHFSTVRDLLWAEDPADWPAYGSMLRLRGFADEIRQFLSRAQEALLSPEDVRGRAGATGLRGWSELAAFYRRYLDVLAGQSSVDFAGMVVQAAAATGGGGPPLIDHLLVDDYQEGTYASERLFLELGAQSLVVAGDLDAHVFSFQGTTDVPLRRFVDAAQNADVVALRTQHRTTGPEDVAWAAVHSSEEHDAIARELRRIHVQEGVPWSRLAVVVRRQGDRVSGLLRALDDAGVPRLTPEGTLSTLVDPASYPLLLALRWLAHPEDRDGLVESLLTSELARLSPAVARGLIRAAGAAHRAAAGALDHDDGLTSEEGERLAHLRSLLARAQPLAERSALDAFSLLWRELPYARSLVEAADASARGRRDLDAVLLLAHAIAAAAERGDPSLAGFLDFLGSEEEGPGHLGVDTDERAEAVRVLTAHGSVGREFDTVVVAGCLEGDFPSLARREPMFDISVLERRIPQAERNRLRLEDERRLFRVVVSRARRRVVFTASEPQDAAAKLTARSRFVAELGVPWSAAPAASEAPPLTVGDAAARWRRLLASTQAAAVARLSALHGLLALGVDPGTWWFQRDWTGTDRPLHENIRTSYSKLDKLENCSLQYVLAEELGLDDRAGYHAWTGHTVHRLIEDVENGVVERTLEAMIGAAEARWKPQEFPSHAVSEAFRRLVTETMLPRWFEWYGGAPAIASEVRFDFQFDGATVTGYIDRITGLERGGSAIIDYKTGRAESVLHPEDSLQLGVYYLAINHSEALAAYRPVRAVELSYLREDPRRNQASSAPMAVAQLAIRDRDRKDYEGVVTERLSGLIGRVRELIDTETYRANPAADCYFCRFKPLCPLWPEGADVLSLGPASNASPADERVPSR